jgi:O-glycosyl hydrolase
MTKQITIKQLQDFGFKTVKMEQPIALICGIPMRADVIYFDKIEQVLIRFQDELNSGSPLIVFDEKNKKQEICGFGEIDEGRYFLRIFYSSL